MRPLELHLSGFTTFRNPTEVDFGDADLFVLSGPTGSGKSSVIDAICFALYGSIPRLTGVAPVISLGRNEARVRLRFEIDGEPFTVSRLVVRQGDGASQRDVRLEGGGSVVEGVRDVDARIVGLLGLGFEHFTRTVVLPQGRFAAFLEDTPAGRERLLKQLLDLGVYEDMRKRAASHAARLDGELGGVVGQLHDLLVTDLDVERAEAGVRRLSTLAALVAEVSTHLTSVNDSIEQVRARSHVVADELFRLGRVEPPSELAAIGSELAAAREDAASAATALTRAEQETEEIAERRSEFGDAGTLRSGLEAHQRVADLTERVRKGEEALAQAADTLAAAGKTEDEARSLLEDASERVVQLERKHAAHTVRAGLEEGGRCPVCEQQIDVLPTGDPPPGLDEARSARAAAQQAWEVALEQKNSAATALASVESLLAERRASLGEAQELVGSLPSPDELHRTMTSIERAEAELAAARDGLAVARSAAAAAEARRVRAEGAGESAFVALDRARDGVAAMEPPVPSRRDPAADWAELVRWCDDQQESRREEEAALVERLADLTSERERVLADLAEEAAAAGISELGDDPKVTVATALTRAQADLERHRADLERKSRLEASRESLTADKARYDELARLLRSNNFQQWLIEEALVGLVEVANAELAKLAGGAYSLVVDGGEFEIVDHRNAEARRSVKTLSGGETFLVSLALALALAERVVATSAVGNAHLDSMFLDEGFGTLDSETLDTVAAVVQELGSGDRMIGLVTHVRELADQIPVRFEVRKLPDGSTVTRVDA